MNPHVAHAVAEGAKITHTDTVLEVGPGKGMLTSVLLSRGATVIAVEKDPAMVAILKQEFQNEMREKKLEIKEMDIRDFLKPASLKHALELPSSYKVAANIPYYITGELLRTFLTMKHQPSVISFLVQKEVAERITGHGNRKPGKAMKESLLSLSVKVYGTPLYERTVKRGNFSPSPSVDSAILSIHDISRKNFKKVSEEMFFTVVKAGFAQKRKTLGGNLKRVFGERAARALVYAGVSPRARAEDVPLTAWLTLSKYLQGD